MLQGINPVILQYLVLIVRREALLQDALAQIVSKARDDLKKPLKVIFTTGDIREEAIDAGGVTKVASSAIVHSRLQ